MLDSFARSLRSSKIWFSLRAPFEAVAGGGSIAISIAFVSMLSIQPARAIEPTVSETLDWMESTYNNHLHTGGSPGHGLLETFLPDNKPLEKMEETISFSECKFTLKKDYIIGLVGQHSDSFNLGDIDPASVKTMLLRKGPYGSAIRCGDPDDPPLLVCNSALVKFSTTNQKPLITSSSGDKWSDDDFFVDDIEYADRFARAFRHTVELCGGRASPF